LFEFIKIRNEFILFLTEKSKRVRCYYTNRAGLTTSHSVWNWISSFGRMVLTFVFSPCQSSNKFGFGHLA